MQRLRGRLSARGLDYDAASFGKYDPNWILAHLPYYRHFGNGVLTATARETEAIYLEHGIKRLVIAVRLAPDLVVFVLHLSLGERSRRRQLRELAGVIQQHAADASVVLLGDFNILNGAGELDALLDTTGLELWEPGPTIAPRPLDDFVLSTRCLDVFCCSPELSVERCDVLDVSFSDHKPVLLEVSL